jgi:hypothetical protein
MFHFWPLAITNRWLRSGSCNNALLFGSTVAVELQDLTPFGRALPEEPKHIAGYGDPSDQHILREGMVITIEPFMSRQSRLVTEADDAWTLVGAKGSSSAQFEHTRIVTRGAPIVVTTHSGNRGPTCTASAQLWCGIQRVSDLSLRSARRADDFIPAQSLAFAPRSPARSAAMADSHQWVGGGTRGGSPRIAIGPSERPLLIGGYCATEGWQPSSLKGNR